MEILVVLRAILYRLRQGCSWRTLSIFGHWETIYGHWRKWVEMVIWEQILAEFFMRAKGKLWGSGPPDRDESSFATAFLKKP